MMKGTETYQLESLVSLFSRLTTVAQLASSPRTMEETVMAKRMIVMAPNLTSRYLARVTARMISCDRAFDNYEGRLSEMAPSLILM